MASKKKSLAASSTSANVGYDAQLWQMADALRGSMDAAEYKHICLDQLADTTTCRPLGWAALCSPNA